MSRERISFFQPSYPLSAIVRLAGPTFEAYEHWSAGEGRFKLCTASPTLFTLMAPCAWCPDRDRRLKGYALARIVVGNAEPFFGVLQLTERNLDVLGEKPHRDKLFRFQRKNANRNAPSELLPYQAKFGQGVSEVTWPFVDLPKWLFTRWGLTGVASEKDALAAAAGPGQDRVRGK